MFHTASKVNKVGKNRATAKGPSGPTATAWRRPLKVFDGHEQDPAYIHPHATFGIVLLFLLKIKQHSSWKPIICSFNHQWCLYVQHVWRGAASGGYRGRWPRSPVPAAPPQVLPRRKKALGSIPCMFGAFVCSLRVLLLSACASYYCSGFLSLSKEIPLRFTLSCL